MALTGVGPKEDVKRARVVRAMRLSNLLAAIVKNKGAIGISSTRQKTRPCVSMVSQGSEGVSETKRMSSLDGCG